MSDKRTKTTTTTTTTTTTKMPKTTMIETRGQRMGMESLCSCRRRGQTRVEPSHLAIVQRERERERGWACVSRCHCPCLLSPAPKPSSPASPGAERQRALFAHAPCRPLRFSVVAECTRLWANAAPCANESPPFALCVGIDTRRWGEALNCQHHPPRGESDSEKDVSQGGGPAARVSAQCIGVVLPMLDAEGDIETSPPLPNLQRVTSSIREPAMASSPQVRHARPQRTSNTGIAHPSSTCPTLLPRPRNPRAISARPVLARSC